MKRLFWAGLAGITLFEILHVYFVMPMPGSQRIDSLEAAYLLHTWRWVFRVASLLSVVVGARAVFRARRKWLPVVAMLLVATLCGFLDFAMTADRMFEPPHRLIFKPRAENAVDENALIVGVERNGEAKAYPIRFLVYHHQVRDVVGGAPVMVTYCSVCRTGRVFEPVVDGREETFRLVGMDHFNAMFEDATTRSWWRQATGVAAVGPRKGAALPEVESRQATLREWFDLHPASLVMQADEASRANYDTLGRFERGESRSALTGTDHASWQEKSWVVGISIGGRSKAYDWNRLRQSRVINDVIGEAGGAVPIALVIATDQASFAAFKRPDAREPFTIADDVISAGGRSYDFAGRDRADPTRRLKSIPAHQEFWHSWRTFHPETLQDRP